MKQVIIYLLLAGSFLFGNPALAQIKYEREFKLKLSDVPPKAKDFVDACKFSKRVKWYKEESEAGNSVEAKVREAGKFFSIEFGTDGELQDVELDKELEELDVQIVEGIKTELSKKFRKHRIQRVQIQWTGSLKAMLSLIQTEQTDLPYTQKYELIVKGKKDKRNALFEVLFDARLQIERIAEIKTRNTDNMDF
ncbi:MAG: hypothetical protein AAGD28_10680 [Bacteroidota bacterium]